MSLEQFWALSLRELWNVRRAHVSRMRTQSQSDLSVAWFGEMFARTKTLPKLDTLLSRMSAKAQTPDEQVDALMQLSDLYNIPIVRIPAQEGKRHGDTSV